MSEAGWLRNLLMDCSPPLRLVPSSTLPLSVSPRPNSPSAGIHHRPLVLSPRVSSQPSFVRTRLIPPSLSLSPSLSFALCSSYRRPTRNTPSRLLFFVFSLRSFFLRVARGIGRYTANRFSVLVHRVLKNYTYKL